MTITRKQADNVFKTLVKQRGVQPDEIDPQGGFGPTLVHNWEWGWTTSSTYEWAILWEGGPFEWAMWFPYGGRDPEFGITIPNVSEQLGNGLFIEAVTSWAIAIYPNQ
jgi:hypothetical protein